MGNSLMSEAAATRRALPDRFGFMSVFLKLKSPNMPCFGLVNFVSGPWQGRSAYATAWLLAAVDGQLNVIANVFLWQHHDVQTNTLMRTAAVQA